MKITKRVMALCTAILLLGVLAMIIPAVEVSAAGADAVSVTNATQLAKALVDSEKRIVVENDIDLAGTVLTISHDVALISGVEGTVTITQAVASTRHMQITGDANVQFDDVVLDGGGKGGGVELIKAGDVVLMNAVIKNCWADSGGGILARTSNSLTLVNGVISGNTSTGTGGGVLITYTDFTLDGTDISENTSAFGGAGIAISSCDFATMQDGTISRNTVTGSSSSGGGIYIASSTFIMTNGTISDNAAPSGGGVRAGSSTLIMEGGEIIGNTATSTGGGGVILSSGTFSMCGGTISGNTSTGSNPHGGGVRLSSGTMKLEGGEISGNSSSQGGGVYVDTGSLAMEGGAIDNNTCISGGGVYVSGSFTMLNGRITGNTASNLGGGICVYSGSLKIVDGTINNNASSQGGGVYFLSSNATTDFAMSGGVIDGNAARTNGGGICLFSGNAVIDGGQIEGNEANRLGGGIYHSSRATLDLNGGILADNVAPTGGGIYTETLTEVSVSNVDFIANAADEGWVWELDGDTVEELSAIYRQQISNTTSTEYFSNVYNNFDIGFSTSGYTGIDVVTVYTVSVVHLAENGVTLVEGRNVKVPGIEAAICFVTAVEIDGSVCVGYRIDDGDLQVGNAVAIERLCADTIVTFVYSEEDESQGVDGGGETGGTNKPETPAPEPGDDGGNQLELTGERIAYIQGYGDGTVRPEREITRAEVAIIFWRLTAAQDTEEMYIDDFEDVEGDEWFAQAVAYLAHHGVLNGYPDGTFRPEQGITRAELVKVVSQFDALQPGTIVFPDVEAGHWAEEYILNAVEQGWVLGYPDGSFKPDVAINRAEAVTIINRLLGWGAADVDHQHVYTDIGPDHWAYADVMVASGK